MVKSVTDGPKPTFSLEKAIEQQNEQAVRDGVVSLADSPIVLPPGMKAPSTKSSKTSGGEGAFKQTGDAPPPPAGEGNPQAATGVSDAMGFVSSLGGDDLMGNLFACMIAYQKIMNKEAREDRKLSRDDKALELKMKEGKLQMESQKIDMMKVEAGERFDAAMRVADAELIMGCISIGAAALSAISSGVGAAGDSVSKGVKSGFDIASKVMNFVDIGAKTAINYSIREDRAFTDKQKKSGLASDNMQKAINNQQSGIDRQTNSTEASKDFADAAKERRTRGLDNVQKLLDIIRSMNPQL